MIFYNGCHVIYLQCCSLRNIVFLSFTPTLPRVISYASLKCRRGVSIKPPSPSPGPAPSRLHRVVFVTRSVSSTPDYLRPDRIIKTPVLFSSPPPSRERLRCGGSGGRLATTRRLQVRGSLLCATNMYIPYSMKCLNRVDAFLFVIGSSLIGFKI
jgi:hypothetical protein